MLYFPSLMLIAAFALTSEARKNELQTQLPSSSRTLDVEDSVCSFRDYSGMLSVHDHNHHHDGICMSRAHLNHSSIPRTKAWSDIPTCQSHMDGEDFCIYANSSFAGGRGLVMITTAGVADSIAKSPAFTSHSTTRMSGSPPFEVRQLPGRGYGVVANRTIERGERLMAHTVLVAVHMDTWEDHDEVDYKFYNSALDRLPNSSLSLYTGLSAHFDNIEPNWEKMNTNSFSEEFGRNEEEHWIVIPETARMNHDCRPNSIYYFDLETLTHYTHATRRIYAGEEITITYIDPVQIHSDRAEATVKSWGFKCTCPLCQAAPETARESDNRINTILQVTEDLEDFINPKATPASTVTPETGEYLISLYEMERIHASIADAYLLTSLAYVAVGNEAKAKMYAAKAVEACMINNGPKSVEVKKAKRLMLEPRRHKTWMSRGKGAVGHEDRV